MFVKVTVCVSARVGYEGGVCVSTRVGYVRVEFVQV